MLPNAHIPSWSGAITALRGSLGAFSRIGGRLRNDAGFTLVEVLVAMVILVVGLLSLLTMLDTAEKASATTRAREGATNLARQLLEDARTIPYAQIIPTSIEGQLQKMTGLENKSSGSSWQIERRGFVYTVNVEECAIDNPKDGLAKTHKTAAEGGTFCPEQPEWKEGIAVDAEPEDLKRITAQVSWTIQKHTSKVEQVFTMTAAGQAVGLIATKLEITSAYNKTAANSSATTPVITEAAAKLKFLVSFPEGASAIDWSLEGAKQGEVTKLSSKTTSAEFEWTIEHVSDGTYQISAQTVNSTGVIGPPISIPVRLIRGEPAEPKKLVGGLNNVDYKGVFPTEVVELEWEANTERDVIGYRVYNPAGEMVCPENLETLSTATSCTYFGTGGKPAEGTYKVAALYRNASKDEVTPSSHVATISVTKSTPPGEPTGLLSIINAEGAVILKWTAPTTSTAPAFYRIYRGSKEYTSRYGTTLSSECKTESGSTACSFTDTEPEGTHEYWVTAVSANLVESKFAGPVSG